MFRSNPLRSSESKHSQSQETLDASTSTCAPSTSQLPTITSPPPVHYSEVQTQEDMMAEFFGARSKKTHTGHAAPPPYSHDGGEDKLPVYPGHPNDEPATLARFMFIYGFLFPPFWIMGIVILCSPLRSTPDWEAGKTEEEKAHLLAEMRFAELKWAKRCLYAALAFVALIGIIVLVACLARRR